MTLIYSTPRDFYAIQLSDDGQADLFHPHRNHLAALHNGVLYYQVNPEFYAYLRLQRETLRERATRGPLPLSAFNEYDDRFMAIRTWALHYHGETAIRAAVSLFNASAYVLPVNVYRPKASEVSLPFFAEINPAETIEPSPPEAPPVVLPGEPQRLCVPGKAADGTPIFTADAPLPNEPLREKNLTAAQASRIASTREKKPEALAHCHAVVVRVLSEVSQIYFASEGFDTPYIWAMKQAAEGATQNIKNQACGWLETLKKAEVELENYASVADIEGTDKSAVLYLAAWRKIIFRYDDFVTEARRIAAEAEREAQR
jgi:hypothetical protein